jgi:hypothetical protein
MKNPKSIQNNTLCQLIRYSGSGLRFTVDRKVTTAFPLLENPTFIRTLLCNMLPKPAWSIQQTTEEITTVAIATPIRILFGFLTL